MGKMITGQNLQSLGGILMEHFNPGQQVEVMLGVQKELSHQDLTTIAQKLQAGGLQVARVEFGSTAEWPNAVRLQFRRPSVKAGEVALLPLAVLVIGALGAVGIGTVLGFKIGGVMDSIGKNILPITLVAGGVFIIYSLVNKPVGAR